MILPAATKSAMPRLDASPPESNGAAEWGRAWKDERWWKDGRPRHRQVVVTVWRAKNRLGKGRTIRFGHAGPSVIRWTGKPATPVVQALRWRGPDAAADARVPSTLSRQLPEHVKRDLVQNERNLAGWALPCAQHHVWPGGCHMNGDSEWRPDRPLVISA